MIKIKKTAILSWLSLILVTISSKMALASATCIVNNKEVPCEGVTSSVGVFLGWGLGMILLFLVIGVWATVFWLLMIIHAIRHNIQDKAVWMILMVFTGIVGAIIYYFAVKRKFNQSSAKPISPDSSEPPRSATIIS